MLNEGLARGRATTGSELNWGAQRLELRWTWNFRLTVESSQLDRLNPIAAIDPDGQ
jgi:hypothetical protein